MSPAEGPRATWRTHALLVAGLALCAAAFWFELGRAERGNTLSWAYVFEWPLLAVFAVYIWWRVQHGEPRPHRERREPGLAPEYDAMRRAWLDHQAHSVAHDEEDDDPTR